MAFTPYWGTGWEMGSIEILPDVDRHASAVVSTAAVHVGTYSALITNYQWFRKSVSLAASVYVAVWIKPGTAGGGVQTGRLGIVLSDGYAIELRYMNTTQTWNAYVNGVSVAAGGVVTPLNTWQHIEMYVNVADAGAIQSRIDGIADVNYSGDTKPGASTTISYIRFDAPDGGSSNWYIDDWIIGTGGWSGDWRCDGLVPTADTATEQWDLSAGADTYALLDERPPSDADYVYTGITAEQFLVDIGNWDATGKNARAVVLWARGWKSAATDDQIKLLLKSGATLDTSAAQDLLTSATYVSKLYDTDPNTAAEWADAAIDALQIGAESLI